MVTSTYTELVTEAAQVLQEDGPLPREEVLTMWLYESQIVNLLEAKGMHYRGESVKDQGWATLTVLKVAREGIPYVVFVTERNRIGCMRVLLRQIEEERLELREDKFA